MKEVKLFKDDKPRIYIIDVTNRDGVQTARISMSKLQKTILNVYLNKLGVFQSEMGFPALGNESNYINANLELAERGVIQPMRLEGWTRAVVSDVEKTRELCPKLKHINISISTSQIMTEGKFGGRKDLGDILKMMTATLDKAKELEFETIGVNAEDASRTRHFEDESYLIEFSLAAREHGADRIRYCDTLGFDDSFDIYDRVLTLAEYVKLPIEIHCHNDLGSAVTNAVRGAMGAIKAGVDAYINGTILGLGERAGNTNLAPVIAQIRHSSGLTKDILDPNIDTSIYYETAEYVSQSFNIPIPINSTVVGINAYAHESGIHADGMLKDRHNYELYSPAEFGVPDEVIIKTGRTITVGEYSGLKGLQYIYNQLGIELEDPQRILRLVQYATMLNQCPLKDVELRFIADYPDITEKILTVDPTV